jgi:ferrous iron transport protein A
MNVHLRRPITAEPFQAERVMAGDVRRLADVRRGDRGEVVAVSPETMAGVPEAEREELERRLLEIGFVEGARIEVLHEGFIGRDPIAVRLDDMRVALRRREAQGVLVRLEK